jgi:hypothetical protein
MKRKMIRKTRKKNTELKMKMKRMKMMKRETRLLLTKKTSWKATLEM